MKTRFPLMLCLVLGTTLVRSQDKASDNDRHTIPIAQLKRSAPVDFDKDILPVLKNHCLACHNKTTAKGGLVLETPADMLKGGDSGPALVAKDGGSSLILKAAAHQLEDTIMPPPNNKVQASNLSPDELGLLKLWIDQGAKGSLGVARPIEWQPLPEGLNPIYTVALTRDGQFAACARANQIFIYHVPSTQLVTRLTDPQLLSGGARPGVAHRDLVHALAFNPDGTLLASGGYREVKLWRRPENAQRLKLASVAKKTVRTLAVSPDGKWFATAGDDGNVRLWNAASGKSAKTWRGHKGAVNTLRFSPDSRRLCSGSSDQNLIIWSVPDAKPVARVLTPSRINAVTWLKDGRQIASGGDDHVVRIWFLDSAQSELLPVKDLRGHIGPVTALDTVPNAALQIISGSGDGTLRVWNVEDGQVVRQVQHGGPVSAVAVRRDGKRFASAGLNDVAKLWDAADGKEIAELKGDWHEQEYVADRERFLAFAKSEVDFRKARLKDAETNQTTVAQRVKKATEANESSEKALAEKQKRVDETREAKAAVEKTLEQLKADLKKATDSFGATELAAKEAETRAKSLRESPSETKAAIETAAAEADAKTKAAADAKAALDKLTAETQEKEKQNAEKLKAAAKSLEDADKEFKKAELTKSNATTELELANQAAEKAGQAVDRAKEAIETTDAEQKEAGTELETAKNLATESKRPIRSLAFSPDNLTLATAGDDRSIHTWSAENGAGFGSLNGHDGVVFAVAFTSDGNPLSAAADRSLISWDLKAPWKLQRAIGTGDGASPIADRVNALKFSPVGKQLATGGGEPTRGGEILIWDVASGTLARALTNVHSDAVFGLDFSRDGKFLASSAADKFVKVVELDTGKVVKQFEGHTHHVLGVSWKQDNRTLASSGADNVIKVWDFLSGDRKKNIAGSDKEVTSISFVGYTDQALVASGDSKIRLIKDDGTEVRSFAGAADFVHCAAATPDGRVVIAGGQDGVLRVWNGTNGELVASLPPPEVK